MPPIAEFLEYIERWQELDRAYYRISSWRIFKQMGNIRRREKLTKAWIARCKEFGMVL